MSFKNEKTSSIYAFQQKPSLIDYPGYMTAVFFVSGCNFKCGFCHNALLMGKPQPGLTFNFLKTICNEFKSNWVNAACITGGEPTLSLSLIEEIHYFKQLGWAVKLDTNGSKPEILSDWISSIDYIAMDIKTGFSGYEKLTGFNRFELLKKSVMIIKERAADYEFRTTIIESIHDDKQMEEIGEIIKGAKRYVIQPFVPRDNLPGTKFRKMPRTSVQKLQYIKEIMSQYADEIIIRGE